MYISKLTLWTRSRSRPPSEALVPSPLPFPDATIARATSRNNSSTQTRYPTLPRLPVKHRASIRHEIALSSTQSATYNGISKSRWVLKYPGTLDCWRSWRRARKALVLVRLKLWEVSSPERTANSLLFRGMLVWSCRRR